MSNQNQSSIGTSLAGGAIASALVQTLFDKGVLSLDESRAVLTAAMQSIAPVMQTPEGFAASHIITELLRGKFSARS